MIDAKKEEETKHTLDRDPNAAGFKVTRRQFIAGTGIIIGGAALGPTILASCSSAPAEVTSPGTTTAGNQPAQSTDPGETLYELTVNGTTYYLGLENNWSLAYVLREIIGLTGTKVGCDRGQCGACTVIIDSKAVLSCTLLAVSVADSGKPVETVEGLSDGISLSPLQQSFVNNQAFQCGFCTPGFLMASKALLDKNSGPSYDEVRLALSGHLCVCGTMKEVVNAVQNV